MAVKSAFYLPVIASYCPSEFMAEGLSYICNLRVSVHLSLETAYMKKQNTYTKRNGSSVENSLLESCPHVQLLFQMESILHQQWHSAAWEVPLPEKSIFL